MSIFWIGWPKGHFKLSFKVSEKSCMDYNESHERKLYETIKSNVKVEKGFLKIIPLDKGFDDSNSLVSKDLCKLEKAAAILIESKRPYIVLDYLGENLICTLNGKFFYFEENLSKNEILAFDIIEDSGPTAEDVCNDIEKLKLVFRNS